MCKFLPINEKMRACECCGQRAPIFASEDITHVCKSRGIGDTIAKATAAIGIKKCGGCGKRQKALNKLLPYGSGES